MRFFAVLFAALLGWPQSPAAADTLARSFDLPILVYHHIRPGPTSTLFVSPEEFDKQIEYLRDNQVIPTSGEAPR